MLQISIKIDNINEITLEPLNNIAFGNILTIPNNIETMLTTLIAIETAKKEDASPKYEFLIAKKTTMGIAILLNTVKNTRKSIYYIILSFKNHVNTPPTINPTTAPTKTPFTNVC